MRSLIRLFNKVCGLCGGKFVFMGRDDTGVYYRCNRCGVVTKG